MDTNFVMYRGEYNKQESYIEYSKQEPYIFISYAHKDEKRVLPLIDGLRARGFRVWYDIGIEAGTEWPAIIESHLLECECVIAFLSQNAMDSQNCRNEINLAIYEKKPFLAIHLEEVELISGMRLQLISQQAMFYYRHNTVESFFNELEAAQILEKCRQVKSVTVDVTCEASRLFDIGEYYYKQKTMRKQWNTILLRLCKAMQMHSGAWVTVIE